MFKMQKQVFAEIFKSSSITVLPASLLLDLLYCRSYQL